MKLRKDRWDAVWSSPTFDEAKLRDWLVKTASRASEEELEAHGVLSTRQALQSISAKKAMGVDAPRSSDTSRPPDEAIRDLADMLTQIETALVWPRQVLATILALLPKSRGGDRAIGLLPLLIKCWSKSRASATGAWSDALEQLWDAAIGGSSALRAALCRSVLDENAVAMNFCAIEVLLDLEQFLDSIDLILLLEVAEKEAFPATVISLEAQACLAPRRPRRHGRVSGPLSAEWPIVVGSNQGVKVDNLFLYPLLQAVSEGAPQVGLSTFVDDSIFRAEGKQQMAIDSMGGALKILAGQSKEARLVLSGKSAVVSSHNCAARQTAVDLGIATTAVRKRYQTQAKRAKNVAKWVRGIFRLRRRASMGTYAQKLHRTGARPALIYGHQVLGAAPCFMPRLCRQASRAIAGKGFGRCLTTTLALLMGDDDPGLALPRQLGLLDKAVEGHEAVPCLWLTGLPPASWTRHTYPEGAADFVRHAGCWDEVERPRGPDGFLDVFGDGSGGGHSGDPKLRQCGVGVTIMRTFAERENDAPTRVAGILAGLPGPKQTVPSVELWAFLLALRVTRGNLRCHTGKLPLVTGWTHGRQRQPPQGTDADLWLAIR
ncbi:unnamed protein product, partial [Prorocentrum cordatum]